MTHRWSVERELSDDDLVAVDLYHDAVNDLHHKLAADLNAKIEGAIAELPAGYRLCLHDGPRVTSDAVSAAFDDNTVIMKAYQRYHELKSGETCGHLGERTEYAPPEAPPLGIITAAPAAEADSDPSSLYDKLREMFERVSSAPYGADPPPVVSPETARRHREAADLPRAPWIAVGGYWMRREPVGAHAPGVDPMVSLFGRRLFRTGQFLARPDGKGGWDVAEVMVTS